MLKRNWNDINDSDSSLSSLEEQEEPAPPMIKQVSAPPALTTASKLKSACDEMSLKKMDKHEGNEVWLYIPNSFYQRCEEVDAILERRTELKKVIRVKNIGWNVLTSRHVGRMLIEEGFSEDSLFIKFIYSNRNEQKTINDQRPKNQKKVTYVQKVVPMEKEQVIEQTKSKAEAKQESRGEKKKVKWVEKSKSMKEEPSKGHEQIKSPTKNQGNYRSPPKLAVNLPKISDQVQSPKRFIEKKPSKAEEQPITKPQQKNQQLEPPQKQENLTPKQPEPSNDITKLESNVQQEARIQAANDSSSEQSVQKQSKKKKKRKLKKPKQSNPTTNQKKDLNPFSFFSK